MISLFSHNSTSFILRSLLTTESYHQLWSNSHHLNSTRTPITRDNPGTTMHKFTEARETIGGITAVPMTCKLGVEIGYKTSYFLKSHRNPLTAIKKLTAGCFILRHKPRSFSRILAIVAATAAP